MAKRRRGRPVSEAPIAAKRRRGQTCDDCRADTAFHTWQSFAIPPAFGFHVEMGNLAPKGKRAVIELVTAMIEVPSGESVILGMHTYLHPIPSNFDLFVTYQGDFQGKAVYVATHSLRAYTDDKVDFDIGRDNNVTSGTGRICVSGYIAG